MTVVTRPGRAVTLLLLANALLFLSGEFLRPWELIAVRDGFALSRQSLFEGMWWPFLTHAFLHANVWHLLFNMLGLWFFGNPVEHVLGTGKFLILYGLSAVGGGCVQMILGSPNAQLLGASGAISGVIAAFATLFPDVRLSAVLFVPLRLRAKYFGLGFALGALVFALAGWQKTVGHGAHLGGCVAGYFTTRALGLGRKTRLEK